MYNQWLLPKILITYSMTKKVNWQLTQLYPISQFGNIHIYNKKMSIGAENYLACDCANGLSKEK